MKKIIIVLLAVLSVTWVSARPAAPIGGFHAGGRTTVIVRGGGWYNPFYSPFSLYYGYPMYPYATVPASRPTKLDLQIEDIRNNYTDKIRSARLDDQLTRKDRRQVIKNLKAQRDADILNAKKNFYKS